MRHIADIDDYKNLNAEPWMLECLKYNPSYVSWGNNEDSMWKDDQSWQSRVTIPAVSNLNDFWELNAYNECVHFYFLIERKNEECFACEGSGYNEETKEISDTWYDLNGSRKLQWAYALTQDEVDALWKANRLHYFTEKPTAEVLNAQYRTGTGHDCINRTICIETRAKRLGVWGDCPQCEGSGRIYTEPRAKLQLQTWIIHPRKGASRGLLLEEIKEHELPEVFSWLKGAAKRNAERFSKIP